MSAHSHSLPDRPDLDQLRRQAKELRNAARESPAAKRRKKAAVKSAASSD